jgi:hypothetical protein
MRVFGSTVELAAEGNSPDAKTIKVQLKARQRGPIDHPYWGRVWHDLSTMRSRSKIALDDTHDVEVGHGRPVMSEYGLEVEGVLVTNPDNPQHPANRIAYNLRNGIPQEASIDFGGDYEVMEIGDGAATMVNGMEAKGPALVVRNWPLRACAICKEGADASTETNTLTSGSAAAPLPRAITTVSQPKETPMPETTSAPAIVVEAPPAETLTETKPAVPAETAPVVPVVEAVPVVQPETLAAVDALQAVAVELEQVKTELAAVLAEKASLIAEIAQLQSRIATLSKGIAPVPVTPAAAPMTWMQALASVRKDKPQFSEHQIHTEAAKRFPKLDPNNRS